MSKTTNFVYGKRKKKKKEKKKEFLLLRVIWEGVIAFQN